MVCCSSAVVRSLERERGKVLRHDEPDVAPVPRLGVGGVPSADAQQPLDPHGLKVNPGEHAPDRAHLRTHRGSAGGVTEEPGVHHHHPGGTDGEVGDLRPPTGQAPVVQRQDPGRGIQQTGHRDVMGPRGTGDVALFAEGPDGEDAREEALAPSARRSRGS